MERFSDRLLQEGLDPTMLPVIVNSNVYHATKIVYKQTTTIKEREAYYKACGVFSVTPRILVVDFIQKRLSPSSIKGFLVYKAHKINETQITASCLKIYKYGLNFHSDEDRNEYKQGFVKCFSDDVIAIDKLEGLNSLSHFLSLLKVQHLYLYPRFHEQVKNDFDKYIEQKNIEYRHPLSIEQIPIKLSPLTLVQSL